MKGEDKKLFVSSVQFGSGATLFPEYRKEIKKLTRRKGEYEIIYGGGSKGVLDPTERYEDIYGEDGDAVICDLCGGEMKWKDNECVCPECGQRMDRETFFNYIGAEPPGPECTGCENIYPGCIICPYDYV